LRKIIVGSRGSELALTQTKTVVDAIQDKTNLKCEVRVIKTKGDLDQVNPLASIGATGLFTREIETQLLGGDIDVAVHSLKDLPLLQPEGLMIAAISKRVNPADVLVISPDVFQSDRPEIPLKAGSTVGTSSMRRKSQILRMRDDLQIEPIRGNVTTRLDKIAKGKYGASVFAAAGLERLGLNLDNFKVFELSCDEFPPAPGQGALAIEMRVDDPDLGKVNQTLNDDSTSECVRAEREILALFGGGCSLPLGVLIEYYSGAYHLTGSYQTEKIFRRAKFEDKDIKTGVVRLHKELSGEGT